MKIRNVLLVAGALAIAGAVSTSVFAGDPIADRKAAMKANGAAAKVVGDMMAEGGTYDAAKAAEALNSVAAIAKVFPDWFPAGSETGGETTASPKIWAEMDAFKAASAKMAADAEASAAAAAGGKEALGATLGAFFGNCKSCHETFRIAK